MRTLAVLSLCITLLSLATCTLACCVIYAYLTAEKGVKGRWSKDWLRNLLLSKVRKAHQWMLLTKSESSASCAVGEFPVLRCPSTLQPPAPGKLVFPMVFL
jgi:hypothetical protein